MRRIPTDVERLMWLVAEERDPRAIADFEARFPELKLELAKHLTMVRGLKKAARKLPPHEIPRFVPRYSPPKPYLSRSAVVAFAFVLGAIVFGSVAVGGYLMRPPPPVAVVPKVNLDPPKPTQPLEGHGGNMPAPHYLPNNPPPAIQQPLPAADDPLQKPVTLKVDRAPLAAAIAMVCKDAGVDVQVAPGLATEEVGLDYEGWTALDILNDLGQKYGFTAVPQEKGSVLVIPARDASVAKPDSANGPSHDRSDISRVSVTPNARH